jgi:hypothetical protein
MVISLFNREPLGASDVKKLLPEIPDPTLERQLRLAVESGGLIRIGGGKYQNADFITSLTHIGMREVIETRKLLNMRKIAWILTIRAIQAVRESRTPSLV